MKIELVVLTIVLGIGFCKIALFSQSLEYKQISGVYPHLAMYNDENSECGVGAVVPWANRLWVITYAASNPYGSSDKLYEISPDLGITIRDESIGGTHANRFIHSESNQLLIGYHLIDQNRNVRTIPFSDMPGRLTGTSRHLSDPTNKVYYGAMEGGFYEVDVNTLNVDLMYRDASLSYKHAPSIIKKLNDSLIHLPRGWDELLGDHGKGMHSGQGVLVFSNNGERAEGKPLDTDAGSLSEWDGEKWSLVRRNQFCEVTGPGGIYGNENPETDPIWATGWDHKSLLLGVRNHEFGWHFYRLPKASYTYDGLHGHFTEWPRIRNIGSMETPDFLMTMHGMFWHFPEDFNVESSGGIRPRSSYLKILGDFARWNGLLVFGSDDSPYKEFNNKRLAKGQSQGSGQSNTNLWFTDFDTPDQLGPTTASGAVWLNEQVKPHSPSEPMLFAGWENRCVWLQNSGSETVEFIFEVDLDGNGKWSRLKTIAVMPDKTQMVNFNSRDDGEWIRIRTNKSTIATATFFYTGNEVKKNRKSNIFSGLSEVSENNSVGGLLYGLGENRKSLGIAVQNLQGINASEVGYYELDDELNLVRKDDPETYNFIKETFKIPRQIFEKAVQVEESSILIVDDKDRRWRLPLGSNQFTDLTKGATMRVCREVVTERDLFNCHGTFYELPAESADGYAKIRPIASHNYRINDYASYRGLLILTGISPDAKSTDHLIRSQDGKAAVWAGVIDDLWKLGKPTGHGGPWNNSEITPNVPSDPYLIGYYDDKTVEISHDKQETIKFTMEVLPLGHDSWLTYKQVSVAPNKTFKHSFPKAFQARWIRFVADKECRATTYLEYK